MLLNPDHKSLLVAFNEAGVEYLIVGAHAVAAYGNPRATGDIDLFVRPSPENSARVWQALRAFKAPLDKVSPDDFAEEEVLYQMGIEPWRIDILTSISGVTFDQSWEHRQTVTLDGVTFDVIGRAALIANKRASGRPKDILDADWLEAVEGM